MDRAGPQLVAVATVLILASGLLATSAAGAGVEISTSPAKLELSASGKSAAQVLVTNNGEKPAERLTVAPARIGGSSKGASVEPVRALPRLEIGQTRVFTLTLPRWSAVNPPPPLTLLAHYRSGEIHQVAATSVELTAPTPLDVTKVATVQVKASLATLRSGQSEPVYLLVENKAAQPLTVTEVIPSSPSFIEFEALPRNVVVEPGQVGVLEFEAKASSRVKPGEQQLVFRLPARSGGAEFDLVASQTAKVGVAGEAEVLAVFNIPSLLVIPGFILIATASILWRIRLFRREWDGEAFPFPLKEPEFWVLAIAGSIAITFVASRLGTDLLGQYGLEDLIYVWLASMGLGAAIYLTAIPIRNHVRSSRVPGEGDSPISLLRKLARQGLSLKRPRISFDTGNGTAHLFLVQPGSDNRPATWAAPLISYFWLEPTDPDNPDTEKGVEDLEARIREQLNQSLDPAALADSFAEGEQRGLLAVAYSDGGLVGSPTLVPKEKIGPAPPTLMVREQ